MEIGIGVDPGARLSFPQHREMIQETARLGYSSAWTPAGVGQDAFQVCAQWWGASAEMVEGIVVDAVRARIADAEGRASAEASARQAAEARDRAQADLDAAIRAFAGVADEPVATGRIAELRAVRDAAQDRVERLGGAPAAVTINAAADWDHLSLDARRALIRATVGRVLVAPGRGAGRVLVELFGE